MPKQKILLIILIPLVLIVSILFYLEFSYRFLEHKPIPSYQKVKPPAPLSICKKIQSDQLEKLCLSKVQNTDLEINWQLLGPNYGPDGEAFCVGLSSAEEYFIESKTLNDLISYCEEKEKASGISQIYCKAVLINPHYCIKTYLPPGSRWLPVLGDSPGLKECYQDIAVIWQDHSLCEKAKDKDFCYLRLAARLTALNLDN